MTFLSNSSNFNIPNIYLIATTVSYRFVHGQSLTQPRNASPKGEQTDQELRRNIGDSSSHNAFQTTLKMIHIFLQHLHLSKQ